MNKGEDTPQSRRDLLRAVTAASTVSLAGCNYMQGSAQTPTPADDQPPTIEQYSVTPAEAGTVLEVSLTVTDNRELESAEIVAGGESLTKELDGTEDSLTDRLTDLTIEDEATEPRVVRLRVRDAAGNQTETQVTPDSTPPSLTVTPETPTTAGELLLSIDAEDNAGLGDLYVTLGGESVLEESLKGQRSASTEMRVSVDKSSAATLGEPNRLFVTLTDTLGNSTKKTVKQYVRKYDTMTDTRLNLGGIYISQAGSALSNTLSDEVDTEPAVGIYNSPIPPEITSRHIDQMTGFGFNRVVFDTAGVTHRGWAEAFLEADLLDQVEVMPFYIMPRLQRNLDKSWKDDVFAKDLPFLKEKFLERENAVTVDGRPVCSTWNYMNLHEDDDLREKLLNEFGSYEAFVQHIRDGLRTDRGDPYLICGVGGWGDVLDENGRSEFVTQFDAITSWFNGTRGGWDAVLERAEEHFKSCREFVQDRNMEYIPVARPGYDERWDTGDYRTTERYLPRDPDRFRQLLNLADEYRTTDRINIPFNDWIEGHTIEPGTFTGTEYGTEYLEVVKEFQQPE